ncbi:MAG: undecaprenyl/decaprenyl-phosphate alpha-N-acetylglucosaminyl 1-phosphate transferase [Deltaproteobacteria bacterium]|nr:undecaprenyl/decaprenyl-phosphate alpha-N-acetylglucosaminyl 1-phosphate transferase [Deltaproteobacteria bacterium]
MDLTLPTTIVATFIAGLTAFRFAIPLALRYKLVDVPNSRRRHARPMPIIGGAAVFAAWFVGVVTYCLLKPEWFLLNRASLLPIGVSITMLLSLGLVDDLRGLGPRLKLGVQLLAAINVITFEPIVHAFCLHWLARIGFMIWPITVIWLVGLSNAINLVDGLDGLAGGISLLVASSLVAISAKWGVHGQLSLVLMAALIPALMAFLRKNWNPADIFLGDNGSLPIGFLFGVVSLMCPPQSRSWVHAINIILMMGYPIMDMGLCTYRRFRKHTPLFKADRNHLHHRLLRLGMTVRQTATMLLSLTIYLQLTAVCVVDLVRTDEALFTNGLVYMCAIGISMFSLFYLLRAIELKLTARLAAPDERQSDPNLPQFRQCTVVRIELEPLFETGLFEEKERVHQIVACLKLMMQTFTRKDDLIYMAHKELNIVLSDTQPNDQTIKVLEIAIKEKLVLFQNVFNLQYSMADLPVKFTTEEFLIQNNAPKRRQADQPTVAVPVIPKKAA